MLKKYISIMYNIMFTLSEYLTIIMQFQAISVGLDGSGPAEVAPLVYQSVIVLILKRGLYCHDILTIN